jgi:hypothetical protein
VCGGGAPQATLAHALARRPLTRSDNLETAIWADEVIKRHILPETFKAHIRACRVVQARARARARGLETEPRPANLAFGCRGGETSSEAVLRPHWQRVGNLGTGSPRTPIA